MVSVNWFFVATIVLSSLSLTFGGKVIVDRKTRNGYISEAQVFLPDQATDIASKDLINGPGNPYGIKVGQTIDCNFVEPSAEAPIGGVTPKFMCEYRIPSTGEKVQLKIKYDQQYNSVFPKWGHPNQEVYAAFVSQRLLWATGFGADTSIPVKVRCHNCPIEPWTYVQVIQGYGGEDIASGWIDMKLIESGEWNHTVPLATFDAALVYIKMKEYYNLDDIIYYKDPANPNKTSEGWDWQEMFVYPNFHKNDKDNTQTVARHALSAIASFISHVDNFDENQALVCVDFKKSADSSSTEKAVVSSSKDKSSCKDTPFLYVHDVGMTFGYGFDLKHKNFWPNAFDLQQWHELSAWGNLGHCEALVNGIPGCSWRGNLLISEEGRAMAANLLGQLTRQQITDLFTAARANLMRNDSISDWVDGFTDKLQRDLLGVACDN